MVDCVAIGSTSRFEYGRLEDVMDNITRPSCSNDERHKTRADHLVIVTVQLALSLL